MSVLTTQNVTVTIPAGSSSATATLSGITNLANCVPMTTKRVTAPAAPADGFGECAVRVDFINDGADKVQCTTEGTNTPRALVVEVGVWEFDGTEDTVTSGQIVDTAVQAWNDTIALAGAVTDAFLIHSWSSASTANQHNLHNLRGVITDTENVDFDVLGGQGADLTISWWVVEATTGNFATQPVTIAIADTASSNTATINPIAKDKTFLVGSVAAGLATDVDANSMSTGDVVLTNGTTITLTRVGTQAAMEWAGHAVTMAGANALVQRGTISDDASGNATVDLTAGGYQSAGANAVVHVAGCMGSHTSGSFAGTESLQGSAPHCAFTLEAVGDTLRMQRNISTADNTNDISWEVIEWDTGGAPPAVARRVMVIS